MKFKWDLNHLYSSDDEWERDFKILKKKVELLEKQKEQFLDSSEKFYQFLKLKIEVDQMVEKVYCYPRRRLDLDSTIDDCQKKLDNALEVYSKIQVIQHFFEQSIISNSNKVKEYININPLNKYDRYLQLI